MRGNWGYSKIFSSGYSNTIDQTKVFYPLSWGKSFSFSYHKWMIVMQTRGWAGLNQQSQLTFKSELIKNPPNLMIKIITEQGKYCSGFRMRCITFCIIQWRLCNGGKFADRQATFYSQKEFSPAKWFQQDCCQIAFDCKNRIANEKCKNRGLNGRFIPGMSPINFDVLLHFVSLLIIPIKSFQNVYSTLESFEQSNIIKSRHSDSHPPVISLKT